MAEAGKKNSLRTELRELDPREIQLLKVNARYMSSQTFARLVENIRRDGCLTSIPLCYQGPDGTLRCISGNHRTKAAIEAGLERIAVQVITTPISEDDFIAKQLSHNALVGLDNQDILRLLWEKMQSVDAKLYSGLDKGMIEKLDIPSIPPIDMCLEYEQVTLLFLGSEKSDVEKVLMELRKRGIMSRQNWLETLAEYETIVQSIQAICERESVHNYATAVAMMARCAQEYLKLVDAGEVTLGHAQ